MTRAISAASGMSGIVRDCGLASSPLSPFSQEILNMQLKIAAAILLGATAVHAQCTVSSAEIRTFDPWSASFYYPSQNGNTLNQYLDLTVDAPLTINQM